MKEKLGGKYPSDPDIRTLRTIPRWWETWLPLDDASDVKEVEVEAALLNVKKTLYFFRCSSTRVNSFYNRNIVTFQKFSSYILKANNRKVRTRTHVECCASLSAAILFDRPGRMGAVLVQAPSTIKLAYNEPSKSADFSRCKPASFYPARSWDFRQLGYRLELSTTHLGTQLGNLRGSTTRFLGF